MAFRAADTGKPLSSARGFSVWPMAISSHTHVVTSQSTTIHGRGFVVICHRGLRPRQSRQSYWGCWSLDRLFLKHKESPTNCTRKVYLRHYERSPVWQGNQNAFVALTAHYSEHFQRKLINEATKVVKHVFNILATLVGVGGGKWTFRVQWSNINS